METHEQMLPTNGSKPNQIGGGDVSNIRILYRPHKKIVSTFFVLIAFLIAFSESWSQEYNSQYDHCRMPGEAYGPCGPWQQITEIIEWYNGCYIEATYAYRECIIENPLTTFPYREMELIGYRITNFPSCMGLYNSLYNPDGTLNLLKHREIQLKIYGEVSNRFMKNLVATLTPQEIEDDYTCVPCTTLGGTVSNYCSKKSKPFLQIYSGDCMAICIAKETINVSHDPYGPPAGMSAPNIIIPPNYQATIPPGVYNSHYFSYVKCNIKCCLVYIDYCYVPPSDPNVGTGSWMRLYNSRNNDNQVNCNPTYVSSNICPLPVRLWGSIINVEFEPILQCQQSCTTIVDQLQTQQW